MSIKNSKDVKYNQCQHRKKIGEYCTRHSKSKKIIRIDDVLNSKNIPFKFDTRILFIEDECLTTKKMVRQETKSIEEQLTTISGPAYTNICVSHDDVDPISLETLWKYDEHGDKIDMCEFDKKLVFSYRDKRGFIRCFNIKSLKEILDRDSKIDPISGEEFETDIFENMKEKIKILEDNNLLRYDKIMLTPNDELKFKITKVLKLYDELDIWIDAEWVEKLTMDDTRRIYNEIKNMWDAFSTDNSNLANDVLNGKDPFVRMNNSMDLIKSKNALLDVFENFVINGINKQSKLTGAIIVIGGFAYVSKDVKERFKEMIEFI